MARKALSAGGDPAPLNATGAALLGLLAIDSWPHPWTTYELTKQSRRSLHWFWPRPDRHLYDEPKKLVARGYATASRHATGRRRSTVYTITREGRAALAEWLDREGRAPRHEIEQLLRVFFADQGTVEQLDRTLARMQRQAWAAQRDLAEIVRAMDDDPDDARAAVNALSIRLVADLHRATLEWARWARREVAAWDSTSGRWPGSRDVFTAVVADAEWQPTEEPDGAEEA